jgi:tetratricopeptide (TPR) repeat protein
MRTMSIGLLAVLLLLHTYAFSQAPKEDTAYVNRLLQESKEQLNEDPEAGRNKAVQAKEVAERIDFPIGQAYALKNIGLAYVIQGKYVEALDYYEQSLRIFREQGDKIGIANLLNNIGSIYADKGDDAKALEYCLQSLKIAEPQSDRLPVAGPAAERGAGE